MNIAQYTGDDTALSWFSDGYAATDGSGTWNCTGNEYGNGEYF